MFTVRVIYTSNILWKLKCIWNIQDEILLYPADILPFCVNCSIRNLITVEMVLLK